jgi:high-affinity nickel permease
MDGHSHVQCVRSITTLSSQDYQYWLRSLIGGLEVAQVFAGQLNLTGGFWDYANDFDINRAGFIIVGMFVAVWAFALLLWRFGNIETSLA